MRSFAVAVALGVVLGATTPLLAQTGQPAGLGQAPTAPAAPAQPAAQPPRPFPEGAKVAVVNIQRVAQESTEGKAATAKVQALHQQKTQQLNDLNKKLQADQQRLQQQQSVMNEQARGQLERDIERQQKDVQRFSQDAQEEVQNLQGDLQEEFQRKLLPIIQQVVQEKGLHLLLSLQDAGVVWWDPGLDITADVIKRFDAAGGKPASSAAPSSAPPASAPASTPSTPQPK